MLPILAAVLAFITIGGLGWVFVGGDDSSGQAVKRAQNLGEGKRNAAKARKAAAAANTPEARRKQIMVQLQEAERRERKARANMAAKLKQAGLTISVRTFYIVSGGVGLIAAVAVFFVSEYVCRRHAWPALLATVPIAGNPGIWRIRLAHRLLLLWLAIGFLPLSAVALTASMRLDGFEPAAHPLLLRVVSVVIFIAASAALGGAGLAWLLARSMDRPLRALEQAMARLRGGDFSVRESVRATDEIGGLAEGFNLMAERLSQSYAALETRNRELAGALDRVAFLESVKRGLDRFVPDTVRRALEENPDATALQKRTQDVTVLFLDIEGYARLSEQLPREGLTALVERYFSLVLSDIRAEGGDINETAGDGLMILFQAGGPDEHAAAAVRAALAIRDKTGAANRDIRGAHPPIVVNVGISSGECDLGLIRLHGAAGERWTFTATGPVTNLAARLGDRAAAGQILVSPETARRLRGHFRLRSLGGLSLKNISNPVEAWEVTAAPSAPVGVTE